MDRRTFLSGACGAAAFALPRSVFGVEERRPIVPPKSKWTEEQVQGRAKVERRFRQRRIPRQHRDQLFEGLVYAVQQGKRKSQEIVDTAGEYLTKTFPEVPNWLKWLALMLSIMASILAILLLFI